MNLICALPVLLLAIIPVYTQKIVDGVYELTQADFGPFIESNDHVLVEFYTPWCKNCIKMAPEFVKAAADLKQRKSKIKLGKIDISVYTGVAKTYGIQGIPVLKFFRKGHPLDYNGERTAAPMVKFALQKVKPPVTEVKTVDEVKNLIKSADSVAIGFFVNQQSEGAKTFLRVASSRMDCAFGITSADRVFSEFSASDNAVILFKKADNERVEYERQLEHTQLKNFLTIQSLPLILDFNDQTKTIVFGGTVKLQLIFFAQQMTVEILEALRTTAKLFKGTVLFVFVRMNGTGTSNIQNYFGVKQSDAPTMRMIDLRKRPKKFKPKNGDLRSDSIKGFVEMVENGSVPAYVRSENPPSDWNRKPLWTLVGSNFEEVAYDRNKSVLVSFSAPWCGYCRRIEPVLEQVGKHFANDSGVVVGKIDMTVNEVRNVRVRTYPTLYVFRKGDNKAILFKQARTADNFIQFIKNSGS